MPCAACPALPADRGYNAVQFERVYDSWVDQVRIVNPDNGLLCTWMDRTTIKGGWVGRRPAEHRRPVPDGRAAGGTGSECVPHIGASRAVRAPRLPACSNPAAAPPAALPWLSLPAPRADLVVDVTRERWDPNGSGRSTERRENGHHPLTVNKAHSNLISGFRIGTKL